MDITIKQGTFTLVNTEKVRRVIDGSTNSEGKMNKGLGKDAKPEDIIAEYDKLGGLIKGKEGAHVKTGSFYDIENKRALKEPTVVYQFRINGEMVEVPADEELPLEVKAAVKLEKKKTEKKTK